MKSLLLAAGVAILAIPHAPAKGGAFTLGGPLALDCYEAALDRDNDALALESCTRALREEPLTAQDRAATHVNRGVLRMVSGLTSDADADFDAALALDRNSSDAWLNKAFLRIRNGHGREALPLLDQAMRLHARRQALAYFARGIAHEQMGDVKAAYADLRRAQEIEPGWALPGQALARYQTR